jgi:hypothetical protein
MHTIRHHDHMSKRYDNIIPFVVKLHERYNTAGPALDRPGRYGTVRSTFYGGFAR